MAFVFYDTETTGLETSFDQILQFGAIRVDDNLEVIDPERDILNLRCRRLPHIVPSPGALMVTGTAPLTLETAELSHYAMMKLIAAKFREWSPAVFVGYNSMRFDEVLLRQGFFQNLALRKNVVEAAY